MTFYAVYLLCVAAAAAIGWVDWQLATGNLPGHGQPADLRFPDVCPGHHSRAGQASPRNGPDLSAIIVARPALYHTLATIYTYDPQPMSPFLANWETGHAAWCRERGIPYQGLARP